MHIAVASEAVNGLLPSLNNLLISLNNKSNQFEKLIKIGRTHLQDAVPLTLGKK
jgi:fumarate hydratase class II